MPANTKYPLLISSCVQYSGLCIQTFVKYDVLVIISSHCHLATNTLAAVLKKRIDYLYVIQTFFILNHHLNYKIRNTNKTELELGGR